MCEPISAAAAISAATAIGGAVINKQQQNAAVSANRSAQDAEAARRSSAMAAERVRQEGFDRRAREVTAGQLSAADRARAEAETQAAADARGEGVDAALARASRVPGDYGEQPVINDLLRPTAAASGATVQDAARGVSKRLSETRRGLLSKAYLSGLEDNQAAQGRGARTAASDLETLSGLRRGSLSAYGTDLNRETPTYRPGNNYLGDALLVGGNLAAGYAGRAAGSAAAGGETFNGVPVVTSLRNAQGGAL